MCMMKECRALSQAWPYYIPANNSCGVELVRRSQYRLCNSKCKQIPASRWKGDFFMPDKHTSDFTQCVADHRMTIETDNGVHRSVYFGRPGQGTYHFRLNTWPGHLCISGDMGAYVFSRVNDMFKFFRGDKVNLGYWAEKVQSESRFGSGVIQYAPERLRDCLVDWLKDHERGESILADLEPYLTTDYGQDEAFRHIYEYGDGLEELISDMSWRSHSEYTHHFKWCCEAIVWGIAEYDQASQANAA